MPRNAPSPSPVRNSSRLAGGRAFSAFARWLSAYRDRKWTQALLLALPIVPVLLLAGLSYRAIDRSLTQLAVTQRQDVAHLAATSLRLRFDNLESFGVSLSYRVRFQEFLRQGRWKEAIEALAVAPGSIPDVDRIFIVDPKGTLMADWPAIIPPGRDLSFREWYLGVSREWRPYVSNAYKRTVEPPYNVIAAAIPVKDARGALLGVLVLQVRATRVAAWTDEAVLGRTGFITVVDREGNVAAQGKVPDLGDLANLKDHPVARKVLGGAAGWEIAADPSGGGSQLMAYEPVPGYGWGVIAQQSAAEAFATRDMELCGIVLLFALLLAVGSALAFLLASGLWELWESGEKFRITVETTKEWIWAVDAEGRSTYDNPALEGILGYTPGEMRGRHVFEFIHPDDQAKAQGVADEAIRDMAGWSGVVLRWRHKDGGWRHIDSNAVPVFDAAGSLAGFQGANRDVTERERFERELQEARDAALESAHAKSSFLANMSHEIRTPMNGVIGMASLLAETSLTPAQHDYVGTIRKSGEALLEIINEILDFSKIESGKMPLEARPFNLRQVVEEALDLFAVAIREKRLEAAYLIEPAVAASLVGDAGRLRQILVNLVGNAIKFTPAGEIVVTVRLRSREEGGDRLLFSVSDTGIGIPAESIGDLFQSFQQVDGSATRRYGGTGLGLAISRRLAELMGGAMWVESAVGRGSTFYFTVLLPASPSLGVLQKPRPLAGGRVAEVLVVDDNATNRRILGLQIADWGMGFTGAASGREALEIVAARAFDAILLDFQMPEIDGLELARRIRAIPGRETIPLLLLSSAGLLETPEARSLFRFQFLKPIRQSQLLRSIQEAVGGGWQREEVAEPGKIDRQLGARHPLRILVAEDNLVNQKVALMTLSSMGYHADLAANGREAVDKTFEKGDYDLIFMDIQMPGMDGIAAVAEILQRSGSERRPRMIALTANALEGDREKFVGLGFDGYLSKPLQISALEEVIRAVSSR